MRHFLFVLVLLLSVNVAYGQRADNYPPDNKTIKIDSTNLPIVWIDVNGAMILKDERITAHMKIIHNGDGKMNYGDTVAHPNQRIDYEGYIAIRYRGNSSFAHSRKPYNFRPLTAPLEEGGEKKKVKILGMGKDNKWALLAPYSDRSMIHDMLAYNLARPWMEYTPQGRHCELYLDGIYYGVYVLVEMVSKGKYRLNLDDPGTEGDELTGGYIMEVDRNEPPVYISNYHPVTNSGVILTNKYVFFQFSSPDYEDLVASQISYIKSRIYAMETSFASSDYCNPETGYKKYIDVMNFIDYQLSEELAHNVDAYRFSTKLFKRRDSIDPRFKLVLWDLDLGYGTPYYSGAWRTDGWSYQLNDTLYADNNSILIPFWWYKLNSDPEYTAALKNRWAEYRKANFREDRLMAVIDSMVTELKSYGAIDRSSRAWPRWGKYVWPNYYVSSSYDDEIAHLKQWITDRIAWMDQHLGFDPNARERGDVNGDGKINIADVTALINYLLSQDSSSTYLDAADCNLDDVVNIGDVTALISYLLSSNW